ncbi:MAG TPA: TlyA family RNA methyltransferase [Candidatus Saccharimonadales bacterium]|nr:TlyA family RNA methyltransferase [Candidatus Saccharimonadales bacterium]
MNSRNRLDREMAARGLVTSRSQAESYIKLGKVEVNGKVANKPGQLVNTADSIRLNQVEQYVSRAGLKLASVAGILDLDFKDAVVLDVGSSTGGFTDYALKHGASKVVAVDVGSDQLHSSLRGDGRIDLREKTDIRDVGRLEPTPDIVVIDVSFISLRAVLPSVARLSGPDTEIAAMLKPQFEAGEKDVNRGVVKNDRIRRQILKDFELWCRQYFVIVDKADSDVAGAKGNQERFYLLKKLS